MSIGIPPASYQPVSTSLDFSALKGTGAQQNALAGQNGSANVDAESLLFSSDKQKDVTFGTSDSTVQNPQDSSKTGDSQSNVVKLLSALIMSLLQMLMNPMKKQDPSQEQNRGQDPYQGNNGLGTAPSSGGGSATPPTTGQAPTDTPASTGGDEAPSNKEGTPTGNGDNGTTPSGTAQPAGPHGSSGTGSVSTPKASGDPVVVNQTIKVGADEVFDGKGQTFTASSALGNGDQGENQKPLFELAEGATLKNVNLGQNEADGIHVKAATGAKVTIDNLHAENVGEDLITVKGEGGAKVTNLDIENSSAKGADDKIIQLNANTHLNVDGFKADEFGTMVRTNGGKQFDDMSIALNGVDANHGKFALVKSDSEDLKLATANIAMADVKHAYDKTRASTQHTEL
ncbi:type III helper protein HrpW1 [Pseudomonas syringae CC1557]|uniref:Pectate lyase n=1 Tax=Pseudomonas syringae CC1557 TaxID=1357279 RepID=W0MV55_PSESX|nr:pectate lyase [Pseudomonas syringae]AHG42327.1 type III helper protein HrpW1 [Pseudomonas syringae CC1557]